VNKVIFDNTCNFCLDIKFVFQKLDIFKFFNWIEASDYSNSNIEINKNLFNETIVVLNDKGKIFTEFRACRYIITRIPFFLPVVIFFYIPFLSNYLGSKVYRIISKRRKCYV